MDKKLISMCGLDCNSCGAYIATRDNDDAKRTQTSEEWSKMYNVTIDPKIINCEGCRSGSSVLFAHCKECTMRLCAIKKEVPHCGACKEYPCETMVQFHKDCPESAENLKQLSN